MAEKDKGKQMPSQSVPTVPEADPQMPLELEQTVRDMMQQTESFKRDPRLQHLFVQGEASSTAYDVPRPPVQVEAQPEASRKRKRGSRARTKKKRQQQEASTTSSSFTSTSESSSSDTSPESSRREKTTKKKKSDKPREFKEGGKSVGFITFNGRYG